jgi:hypothetical protein
VRSRRPFLIASLACLLLASAFGLSTPVGPVLTAHPDEINDRDGIVDAIDNGPQVSNPDRAVATGTRLGMRTRRGCSRRVTSDASTAFRHVERSARHEAAMEGLPCPSTAGWAPAGVRLTVAGLSEIAAVSAEWSSGAVD